MALPVASGPVPEKHTDTPEPIAIADVISLVRLAFAEVAGVV